MKKSVCFRFFSNHSNCSGNRFNNSFFMCSNKYLARLVVFIGFGKEALCFVDNGFIAARTVKKDFQDF